MQANRAPSEESSALSIGRLSQATATSPDTIRYYERLGLLPPAPRGTSRHRSFGPEHLRRLLFVRRARALGFTLEDIASLLTLAAPGRRSCASVRALAAKHLNDVQLRLADLQRLEHSLADTVARCTGDTSPACAVLSMLEALPHA
jgi:MerR family mercuric resistance operon transcriptional regulator